MTLLAAVGTLLEERRIPYALIGAAALAVHGVSRSTLDQDLLVTDASVLDPAAWTRLAASAQCDIRHGDADDPLRGVIRITAGGERDVDIVVGRHRWQRDLLARALPITLDGRIVPVARPADLILLKLYAGGSQDRWDIEQLLALDSSVEAAAEVTRAVPALPRRCQDLWSELQA